MADASEFGTGSERSSIQRADMGSTFDPLGIRNEWKLRSGDTGGQYCVLAMTVPPGA
jgi:hypothetical protein